MPGMSPIAFSSIISPMSSRTRSTMLRISTLQPPDRATSPGWRTHQRAISLGLLQLREIAASRRTSPRRRTGPTSGSRASRDPRPAARSHFAALRAGEIPDGRPLIGFATTPGMITSDRADLRQLHGLVAKEVGQRRVEALWPRIEELTARRLGKLSTDGEVDLRHRFAMPSPMNVICELLGRRRAVPPARAPPVRSTDQRGCRHGRRGRGAAGAARDPRGRRRRSPSRPGAA